MDKGMMPAWFFPRGAGPLVSVCMATRNRVPLLMQSIDSLLSRLYDPGNVEFLFKVDDDDKETLTAVTSIKNQIKQPVDIVVSPRGRGYLEMGAWTSQLFQQAKGDWLLSFNDDAKMLTPHWDLQLLNLHMPVLDCWHLCPEDVCALALEVNNLPQSNEFLLIRRKTFALMGSHFPTPYLDSWTYETTHFVKSFRRITTIQVEHMRDTVRDDIRQSTDACFSTGVTSLIGTSPFLGQIGVITQLLSHVEREITQRRWQPRPLCPGWWFWKPSPVRQGFHLLIGPEQTVLIAPVASLKNAPCATMGGLWYPRVVGLDEETSKW